MMVGSFVICVWYRRADFAYARCSLEWKVGIIALTQNKCIFQSPVRSARRNRSIWRIIFIQSFNHSIHSFPVLELAARLCPRSSTTCVSWATDESCWRVSTSNYPLNNFSWTALRSSIWVWCNILMCQASSQQEKRLSACVLGVHGHWHVLSACASPCWFHKQFPIGQTGHSGPLYVQ